MSSECTMEGYYLLLVTVILRTIDKKNNTWLVVSSELVSITNSRSNPRRSASTDLSEVRRKSISTIANSSGVWVPPRGSVARLAIVWALFKACTSTHIWCICWKIWKERNSLGHKVHHLTEEDKNKNGKGRNLFRHQKQKLATKYRAPAWLDVIGIKWLQPNTKKETETRR